MERSIPEPPESSAPSWRSRLVNSLLGLLVLVAIGLSLDWDRVAESLGSLQASVLIIAGLCYLPSWLLRGLRWRLLARSLGDDVPLLPATAAATAGNFLNLILPAKLGDLLWAHAAQQRWGIPYLRALVGVLSGRVLDLWVLLVLGLASAAWWMRELRQLGLVLLLSLLLLSALGSLILARGWVELLLRGPLQRLRSLHDALLPHLAAIFARPDLGLHLFVTGAIWWVEAWVAGQIAAGMGLSLSLSVVFLAIAAANLSKIFPLTPASMGTYEAAAAILLLQLGWGYEAIFAFALAEHLLKNLVNAALGGLALALCDLPMLELDRQEVSAQWERWKRRTLGRA